MVWGILLLLLPISAPPSLPTIGPRRRTPAYMGLPRDSRRVRCVLCGVLLLRGVLLLPASAPPPLSGITTTTTTAHTDVPREGAGVWMGVL